jgi:hypothetical protein
MEDHTNPKFLYPIEFMKDGDKYYFDRSDFAFIRKGNTPKTTVVSIYIKKHSSGSAIFDDNCIYLTKTKGKFKLQYSFFEEIKFDEESVLQETEWIFLKKIKNVSFSCENNEDIGGVDYVFDPYAFDTCKNNLFAYIDGPQFYLDKEYVNLKMDNLRKLLIDYLDHFQEKRNMKDFLEEKSLDKSFVSEDMADGEKKSYKIKIYDLIIETIKDKIQEENKKENGDKVLIKKELTKEERPYQKMGKKELEKALDEAIEIGDKQKMLDLSDELDKRK